MTFGHRAKRAVRTGERALGERLPGQVRDPFTLAVVDHCVLVAARGEAVLVLNRDDGNDLPCQLDLVDSYVREADVPDLPFRTKLGERTERLLDGDGRIDRVELEEIDSLETESQQASFARRP
jgi:hypothetical protein